MKIRYHKNFLKKFKKLPKGLRLKTKEVIKIFAKNPSSRNLYNHPLKGAMKGKRAFSVSGSCRVIFKEFDDYVLVVMLDVGGHPEVYD